MFTRTSRYLSNRFLFNGSRTYCNGVVDMFFREDVQDLLKKLTRADMDKVFRRRRDSRALEPPTFKFMTTSELERSRSEAESRAEKKLKMPPVLFPREEDEHVYDKDEKLRGYEDSNLIFTDITFGKTDRMRLIVVREPDGTLRNAKTNERSRMNELYFPRPGRSYKVPAMFSDPYLKSLLERGEHEYVLERACAQFEPDEAEYILAVERTYRDIEESRAFDRLRSTRHYGPLVYHLASNKTIDKLLVENFASDRLEEAVWLVSLYRILHPGSRSKISPDRQLDFIQEYIDEDSKLKDELQLAFRTYRDLLETPRSQTVATP